MSEPVIPDVEAGVLAACALMAAQIAVEYGVSARRWGTIMREALRIAAHPDSPEAATPAGKGETG